MSIRRYPGVVSFTAEQQSIFFGRDYDINQLQKYIRNRKSVLLYSKSGVGKSSLLKAGVLPKMQTDFLTINIRFYLWDKNTPIHPVERVRLAIHPFIKGVNTEELDKLVNESHKEKPLWYYFKQLQSVETRKILLIFDQFEEFFSYPPEQRLKFKQELYELTKVDIPQTTLNYMVEKLQIESLKDFDFLRNNLDIHTLFAIRYDYLSFINELADFFPDIQENYYELKPLNSDQARDAILKPAARQQDGFLSPVFEIDARAINHIIDVLTEHGKIAIETTILQLICIKLEDIAIEKQNNSSICIRLEEIPPFTGIFLRFYENSIELLPSDRQAIAKIFIEDVLIRNGSRVSFDRRVCIDYLKNEELNKLINCHLLRSEPNSTGRDSIELCHDTIIEPIMQSRNARIEKQKIEVVKQQANQKLRNRIKITFYFLLVCFFCVVAVFSLFIYKKNGELNTANKELNERNLEIREAYQKLSQLMKFDTTNTNQIPLNVLIQKTIDLTEELTAWQTATTTNTCDGYNQYIEKYPANSVKAEAKKNELNCKDSYKSIQMVFVKGGEFIMGNDSSEYEDEKPPHNVTVSDFYIGKYEVTQKQWTDIMGSNPSYFKGCDECPVEQVSWDDVQEFIAKLNAKSGKTYRLPTEAEWEYAAGGGATNRTKWAGTNDENELGDYAWYDKNSNKAQPVGTKKPNSLVIYDMSCNVWEWCNDYYGSDYYANSPQNNPKGPNSGSSRVLRGGSWCNYASYCRVSIRSSNGPDYRFNRHGFRLVRVS